MTKEKILDKKKQIEQYRLDKNDTGSVELQIALLTQRINHLVDHLKQHKKDNATRMGLLTLVGRRKKLISYLIRKKPENIKKLAKDLGIKVKI